MAITAWSEKVSEQLDLLLGERTDFRSPNKDRSDRQPLAHHRRGKYRTSADFVVQIVPETHPLVSLRDHGHAGFADQEWLAGHRNTIDWSWPVPGDCIHGSIMRDSPQGMTVDATIDVSFASHSRAAFSATASSTG